MIERSIESDGKSVYFAVFHSESDSAFVVETESDDSASVVFWEKVSSIFQQLGKHVAYCSYDGHSADATGLPLHPLVAVCSDLAIAIVTANGPYLSTAFFDSREV